MKTQLALIADSANISVEGKLNILGEFDSVFAVDAPTTHPCLWFVAKLLTDATDEGVHRLLLRMIDEDGNTVLAPLTAKLSVPAPGAGFTGDRPSIPVVLSVTNVTFARFGTYTFELRVDDEIVAEVPLYVRKLQGLTSGA